MDKKQNDSRNQPTEGMLKEKTNQDFNKQKPDPNNPNQTRNQKEVKKMKRRMIAAISLEIWATTWTMKETEMKKKRKALILLTK